MEGKSGTGTETKFPQVGDLVNYILEDGPNQGQIRPSIINRVMGNNDTAGLGGDNSPPLSNVASLPACNLTVFTDWENDGPQYRTGVAWKTSVMFSDRAEPRTWHYRDTTLIQDHKHEQLTQSKELAQGSRGGARIF